MVWAQAIEPFSKNLNMKNFKIKTRIIKSLMEEEIPLGISLTVLCIMYCF